MRIKGITLTILTNVWVAIVFGQDLLLEKDIVKIYSEQYEVTERVDTIFNNKPCLTLDGTNQAVAVFKIEDIENVRIEVDIAGEVMPGVGFRVEDIYNFHFVYFRTFLGGTNEAIQYVPLYNGALSWVFYTYPKYEAKAEMEALEWFHAAIELRGNKMKVFVGENSTPQLEVVLDETNISAGNILLRSMFGPSYFANLSIQPLPELEEPPVSSRKSSSSNRDRDLFLTEWEISKQYPRNSENTINLVVEKAITADSWRTINESTHDRINFSKYFDHPHGIVVAKKELSSASTQSKRLNFDFVGKLQIRLNGEIVFNYNKHRFERLAGDTFSIGIDLQEGPNELLFISEGDASLFGEGYNSIGRLQHQNWGFVAKMEPSTTD
ncbi:MAG: hypothetical protein AAGA10_24775 [Bacteroidota bacterium]